MPTPLTRQHFEAIASVLRSHAQQFGHPTADLLAHDMAAAIRVFNPTFDKHAFVEACTPGGEYRNKSRSTAAVENVLAETMSSDGGLVDVFRFGANIAP